MILRLICIASLVSTITAPESRADTINSRGPKCTADLATADDPLYVDREDPGAILDFIDGQIKLPASSTRDGLTDALTRFWRHSMPSIMDLELHVRMDRYAFAPFALRLIRNDATSRQRDELLAYWADFVTDLKHFRATGTITRKNLPKDRRARALAVPLNDERILNHLVAQFPRVAVLGTGEHVINTYFRRLYDRDVPANPAGLATITDKIIRGNYDRRVPAVRAHVLLQAWRQYLFDFTGEVALIPLRPQNDRATRSKLREDAPEQLDQVTNDAKSIIKFLAFTYPYVDNNAPGSISEYFDFLRSDHGLPPGTAPFGIEDLRNAFYSDYPDSSARIVDAWDQFKTDLERTHTCALLPKVCLPAPKKPRSEVLRNVDYVPERPEDVGDDARSIILFLRDRYPNAYRSSDAMTSYFAALRREHGLPEVTLDLKPEDFRKALYDQRPAPSRRIRDAWARFKSDLAERPTAPPAYVDVVAAHRARVAAVPPDGRAVFAFLADEFPHENPRGGLLQNYFNRLYRTYLPGRPVNVAFKPRDQDVTGPRKRNLAAEHRILVAWRDYVLELTGERLDVSDEPPSRLDVWAAQGRLPRSIRPPK